MNTDEIISRTRCWLRSVVVALNFCPFAKRELERDTIRFVVCDATTLALCVEKVFEECLHLDSDTSVATTLIIFSQGLRSFDDFLDCADVADQLLTQQGYDGIYQLASFHPDYCFADVAEDDASNYTNRSPFPMLHLLREADIEMALKNYPQPEMIPQRNIEQARSIGLDAMKDKLKRCCDE